MSHRVDRLPGARLGVRYLLTSLAFWVLFNIGTLLWYQRFQVFYFREPAILALTHLAALGWLTTGLMGIMYITLPATLGVRPRRLRMARAQYWLQVIGIGGLVLTMGLIPHARGRVVFGLLTLVALVIFAHNIAATVGRGKEWHLPEAHFIMALFYLAITGLIGMSYVFYLNSGLVPQTMVAVKVHAHFAGLGWLALTLMGLTYKLQPLEIGVEGVPQRWGLAASVLINLVFWGVFLGYAYDAPALRIGSAVLACAGLACHTLQVHRMARLRPANAAMVGDGGAYRKRMGSLPYTRASCLFGIVAGLLALLLTTGAVQTGFAVEYAYAYVAGVGWFGLYVTGQIAWLLPLLFYDEAYDDAPELGWSRVALHSQVAGTAAVTLGLLVDLPLLVALGAAVNLAASVWVTHRGVRLYWAKPANSRVLAGL